MAKSFIISKKKKLYTNCINLGSFPKTQHVFDATNFSLDMIMLSYIGSFYKALHFLQLDILNME